MNFYLRFNCCDCRKRIATKTILLIFKCRYFSCCFPIDFGRQFRQRIFNILLFKMSFFLFYFFFNWKTSTQKFIFEFVLSHGTKLINTHFIWWILWIMMKNFFHIYIKYLSSKLFFNFRMKITELLLKILKYFFWVKLVFSPSQIFKTRNCWSNKFLIFLSIGFSFTSFKWSLKFIPVIIKSKGRSLRKLETF